MTFSHVQLQSYYVDDKVENRKIKKNVTFCKNECILDDKLTNNNDN